MWCSTCYGGCDEEEVNLLPMDIACLISAPFVYVMRRRIVGYGVEACYIRVLSWIEKKLCNRK